MKLKSGDSVSVRFMRFYRGSHYSIIRKTGTFIKMINDQLCLVHIKGNKHPSKIPEDRVSKHGKNY